ncbi:MAG: isoprenyl transferase [Desulfobacterales bacterium]
MNSKRAPISAGELDPHRVPAHVAVIMDGNGRWAQKRLLNRIKGHEKGAEAVRTITESCIEFGIPYLTLYAFSTENWERPASEVDALMGLLRNFLDTREEELLKNGIRLSAIGQIDRLPGKVRASLDRVVNTTGQNRKLRLTLALSYGGRSEIIEAARRIGRRIEAGELRADQVDDSLLAGCLDTHDLPDPDLLIRTSGERRVSNFLLWQIAYTEFYFTETLWPDFGRDEFLTIVKDFQSRERRFGRVSHITA